MKRSLFTFYLPPFTTAYCCQSAYSQQAIYLSHFLFVLWMTSVTEVNLSTVFFKQCDHLIDIVPLGELVVTKCQSAWVESMCHTDCQHKLIITTGGDENARYDEFYRITLSSRCTRGSGTFPLKSGRIVDTAYSPCLCFHWKLFRLFIIFITVLCVHFL